MNLITDTLHPKHGTTIALLNDLLIALKLHRLAPDKHLPVDLDKQIETLSRVRDEIAQCYQRIEVKY